MNANSESRRKFLKHVTTLSLATTVVPQTLETSFLEKVSQNENGMRILFQGDSITDGNRGRNNDPNHIMGHGYAFSIASRLGYQFPEKNLQFFNRGISGNRVIDLEKRWKEDTLELKPDVLSILVGINDSSSVVNPNPSWEPVFIQLYNDVYRRLLDLVLKQNPKLIIVLNQPFVFKGRSTSNNWPQRVEDILKRQAIVEKIAGDYNAVYVKLQDAFSEACKKAPEDYWIWDGIHPTVAGHEIITREWLTQVKTRLKFIDNII